MTRRQRMAAMGAATLGLAAALASAVPAGASDTTALGTGQVTAAEAGVFPTQFALPDGFLPEGIAIGSAPVAYFGSRADGDIFRVDLVTGEGEVFSQGPGTPSVGLKVDHRGRLFVSGGSAGDARVVDTASGAVLASYSFASAPTFINDVVLTPDGAWFTDSLNPFLYLVPLGPSGGLPTQSDVVQVPLGGEYVQVPGFNANGIARTPDGSGLLIVQSATGLLFRVDPATGAATMVDLGGALLTNGDGLLLDGHTLFAVRNAQNRVAVVRLNTDGTAGELVEHLTDPRFDVPTTVARFGNRLYLPNARFSTPPTPTTPYSAVGITR